MAKKTLNALDFGTPLSEWDAGKWAEYAGQYLVLEIATNSEDMRERVIDVVGCESEFDRDKYPTAEVVELFPVPEKGAIRILAE